MDEQNHHPAISSSSSSSSQVQEPVVNHQERQRTSFTYRINFTVPDVVFSGASDDVWSSLGILVIFWFFASIALINGFYASVILQLGPNCSRILQANSLLVNEIRVEEITKQNRGLTLYGFSEVPSPNVETAWSETHNISLPSYYSHKEWLYFLNEGSEMEISYSLEPQRAQVSLAIAKGKESLLQWLKEPTYPNVTLSWNIVHGRGMIQQKFSKSSDYYVLVGNLNQEEVKVQMNFRIRAIRYNTTEGYYKCSLDRNVCGFKLFLVQKSAAVITTPQFIQDMPSDDVYVRLSYEPRWITYFVGSGVMTTLVLLVTQIIDKAFSRNADGLGFVGYERTPLLIHKDDDLTSLGSSYDSVSEEELEDGYAAGYLEGKPLKDEENNNPRRLCLICLDAARDCFFLPCGHSATCFTCGTRIADEAGTCPICRRTMKKVRKIFAV